MIAARPAYANTAEIALAVTPTLGEGPLWCQLTNSLYWVDILESKVHRFDPAAGANRTWAVPEHVGTVVTRAKGGLTLALRGGFAHLNTGDGAITRLAQPAADKPHLRFNDGKCDPAGRFWAGTLAYDEKPNQGSLYRLDPSGAITVMLEQVSISNGLAWDLARSRFYYIDSPTRTVAAFHYDHASGAITNRRVAVQATPEDGWPDGMAIDVEGKLWVAHWGGSQVIRWDPETGKALARIRTPASQPSACAFGGPRLDRLYITSARVGMKPEQLAKEPAGSLFVADPGIAGVAFAPFAG
jgi:sugar lactone lactonase YvrE